MRTPYEPISCDFHDLLEALATTRRAARIRYRDEHGMLQERSTLVRDVFSHAGEEFMVTDTEETVRLDRLVEVDGNAAQPSDPAPL